MPWCHHGSCHTQSTDSYKSKGDGLAFVAFEMPNLGWPKKKEKKKKKKKEKKKKKKKKKSKSNARKRSGDNKNAILWTPLLTPFAQTDMLRP
jgi:hypothetical protein